MERSEFFIIAIAGGSGAGKSTLCRKITSHFGAENVGVIRQDSYYIDQSAKFKEDGGDINFDHPESLDFSLMDAHLELIKQGQNIEIPVYHFPTHCRLKEVIDFEPRKLNLVDGTLILSRPNLQEHFDHRVFIQVPDELRFSRRLNRDVKERGREYEGIKKQYDNHVRPMYDEYVGPSALCADQIIKNDQHIADLLEYLEQLVE